MMVSAEVASSHRPTFHQVLQVLQRMLRLSFVATLHVQAIEQLAEE
jgi:hypothetical protein